MPKRSATADLELARASSPPAALVLAQAAAQRDQPPGGDSRGLRPFEPPPCARGKGLSLCSHFLRDLVRDRLVPLALDEAAEGDQSDQRDHDPEPQAPHDRDND